ncbi:hypothetical protein ACFFS2_10620 [Streptomyces aurantiacus]|uniref:Integral membrane protein n=1 Tax=Streptomyces aurantiacus TaxID=47760 RepID=A0A7G1NZH7_9ACTN|nr:hypothetical protein [Streptomyces aurantiacus]BCL28369.1 hypothetical protein GCM10017557_32280 [Streptomyces aurantiacus]
MQGHGQAQPVKPPPPTGQLVFLRVFFVVLSVCSCGLLGWAMMLRLALVTRRSVDWGLLVAVLATEVLGFVLVGAEPGDEIHTTGGWTGLTLLLGSLVPAVGYYLAADIRHFHQVRYTYQGYPSLQQPPARPYGYPQQPYATTTGPHTQVPPMAPTPHPQPQPQPQVRPQPSAPTPTPPPQRPAPARIDQVRAELDELSDYLRKHEDGR